MRVLPFFAAMCRVAFPWWVTKARLLRYVFSALNPLQSAGPSQCLPWPVCFRARDYFDCNVQPPPPLPRRRLSEKDSRREPQAFLPGLHLQGSGQLGTPRWPAILTMLGA